eukprot:c18293_g1_i5.p1 GENE.c18293_g1_i5~~c18293_g1_i5.p1  ORF type:complete len:172 (-),score=21.07 c18293_g1_i5:7-522(-)
MSSLQPRQIVVILDGTGQNGDLRGPLTNPYKIYQALKYQADPKYLQVQYFPGVGTQAREALVRVGELAFGYGLYAIEQAAYRFLMDAVNDDYVKSNGAEIFIIGFSRGAFTARSLVSVVRKCGIGNYEKLSTYYKDSEGSKGDLMKRFLRDVDEMYQIDDKKRGLIKLATF